MKNKSKILWVFASLFVFVLSFACLTNISRLCIKSNQTFIEHSTSKIEYMPAEYSGNYLVCGDSVYAEKSEIATQTVSYANDQYIGFAADGHMTITFAEEDNGIMLTARGGGAPSKIVSTLDANIVGNVVYAKVNNSLGEFSFSYDANSQFVLGNYVTGTSTNLYASSGRFSTTKTGTSLVSATLTASKQEGFVAQVQAGNLSFDGLNITSPAENSQAFLLTGGKLQLNNCTLSNFNFNSEDGLCVINSKDADLALNNCIMCGNNIAQDLIPVISMSGGNLTIEGGQYNDNNLFACGVLATNNTNISITSKAEFKNNKSNENIELDGGSAIKFSGSNSNLTIDDCTFENNAVLSSMDGGAILINSANVVDISKSKFLSNMTPNGAGGAICCDKAAEFNLSSCTFDGGNDYSSSFDSTAVWNSTGGGAAYVVATKITITQTNFSNLRGDFGGGCLYLNSNDIDSPIKVVGCNFENSTGERGGAIGFTGSLILEDCHFTHNSSSDFGGAIAGDQKNSSLSMTDCEFENNSAAGNGGAISVYYGDITISGGMFNQNTASSDGGAIYCSSTAGSIVINNSAVINNNTAGGAGGAIYAPHDLSIDGGTANSNNANNGNGGAIYVGGNLTINATTLSSNTSSGQGGAIYASSATSTLNITAAAINFNNASSSGGGIYTNAVLKMQLGEVNNNTGYGWGGGLCLKTDGNTIYGTDICRNVAYPNGPNGNGGGIDTGASVTIGSYNDKKTQMIGNISGGQGGAINSEVSSAVITIEDALISENTTQCYGGGVCLDGATLNFTGGQITVNTCHNDGTPSFVCYGGGIYCKGGKINMSGSADISSNRSYGEGGGVCLESGATMVMDSGTINANRAEKDNYTCNGGALEVRNGSSFTMNSGTIQDNHADNVAGGVHSWISTISLMGGVLKNNRADNTANNVYAESQNGDSRTTFTLGNVTTSCENDGGRGDIYATDATLLYFNGSPSVQLFRMGGVEYIMVQALMTNIVYVEKDSLNYYTNNHTNGYIAYSTSPEYLESARTHIVLTNKPSNSELTTSRESNFLVLDYAFHITLSVDGYGMIEGNTDFTVPYGAAISAVGNSITIGGYRATVIPTYGYLITSWTANGGGLPGSVTSNLNIVAHLERMVIITVNKRLTTAVSCDGQTIQDSGTYTVHYGSTASTTLRSNKNRVADLHTGAISWQYVWKVNGSDFAICPLTSATSGSHSQSYTRTVTSNETWEITIIYDYESSPGNPEEPGTGENASFNWLNDFNNGLAPDTPILGDKPRQQLTGLVQTDMLEAKYQDVVIKQSKKREHSEE